MNIIMVSSECAPVSKVGGLADVVDGLGRELQNRGHTVAIILPKYDCMEAGEIIGLEVEMTDLWVPYFTEVIRCSIYKGIVHDLKCYFIEPQSEQKFFNRGVYYGAADDAERFAFFDRAALEFMYKANIRPDVIHCHDWQTGLISVLLSDMYAKLGMQNIKVCYTLHNIKHQGIASPKVLDMIGLNHKEYLRKDRLQDDSRPEYINLMKGGIVYSDSTNTVSPQYAWEIKNTDEGYGLERILIEKDDKYQGILNGIDYDTWNPEKDTFIRKNYGISTISDKEQNKQALRERLMIAQDNKPLIAAVGRLDPQKGVHLIKHTLFYALENNCQFVLLGSSPDKEISEYFWHLKYYLNDNPNCHLEIDYDDSLAHMIYAGADMIVVPSLFEPCGLTQLISMKYGTVPIVRKTGGLSDTVFDANSIDGKRQNGFVFNDFTYAGIEGALAKATDLWYKDSAAFKTIMINAMSCDYSWNHPAESYIKLYRNANES
ncbi:MAG: glycogen synthase [Nitrospirae bacterium]|nr:glycogen synthase [Nitrospirota bacterium]